MKNEVFEVKYHSEFDREVKRFIVKKDFKKLPNQIDKLVKDLEKSKKKFAEFFGVEIPPNVHSGEHSITKTQYKGEDAPDASCTMAFFDVGDTIRIELIQPGEGPSTWRECLEKNGEGVHHLAFRIKGMQNAIQSCEKFGMTLEQKGEYNNNKGRYAYMDASDTLKVVVELLEND